jgi:hypothetical protein
LAQGSGQQALNRVFSLVLRPMGKYGSQQTAANAAKWSLGCFWVRFVHPIELLFS